MLVTLFACKTTGWVLFFMVAPFDWHKFLTSKLAYHVLRQVWEEVEEKLPFKVEAIGLLREHVHCVWRLPPDVI